MVPHHLDEILNVDPTIIDELLKSALQQIAVASMATDRCYVLTRLMKLGIFMYITGNQQHIAEKTRKLLDSFPVVT